jgi:YVTN family beta-propeller protein
VATVPVPAADELAGIAVAPDGIHVYTVGYANVYVIDTATNMVVATIPGGGSQIAIVPPPPGVPFLAFGAHAAINFGRGEFAFHSHFTLSSTDGNGIDPIAEPVKVQVGTFSTTIPPHSFIKRSDGTWIYAGVIDGVIVEAQIRPTGTLRYAVAIWAKGAKLAGSENPIQVSLIIGGDSGTTSVRASNLAVALH